MVKKSSIGIISYSLLGWIFAWLLSSSLIADVSAVCGSLITGVWLWNRLGVPTEQIRFLNIGAVFLILVQNSSWITASYLHRFSINKDIETSIGELLKIRVEFSSYALAIVYIHLFCIGLAWASGWNPFRNTEQKFAKILSDAKSLNRNYVNGVVVLCVLVEWMLLKTGIIGQRTIIVEGFKEGNLPAWYFMLESMIQFHIGLNVILFVGRGNKDINGFSKINWLLFSISVATVLIVNFSKGRSPFVYACFSHFFWYCYFSGFRPKFSRTLLFVVLVYPFFSQFMILSNFMRGNGSHHLDDTKGIIELIPEAWEQLNSQGILKEETEVTTENISTRPLVAGVLAACMQLPVSEKSYMLGTDLINAFVWASPSSFLFNKKEFATQEDLMYMHFPVGDIDIADSFYLSAYTEFGWVGTFIYPVILMLMWLFGMNLVVKYSDNKIIVIAVALSFFKSLVLTLGEGAINNLLVDLRTLLFLILVSFTVAFFRSKKSIKNLYNSTVNIK